MRDLLPQREPNISFFAAASDLHVSGYQLLDGKYRLQIEGGIAEMQAEEVVAIEPEDVFVSNPPAAAAAKGPFRDLIEAAASRYNVDAELIASIIAAESNFRAQSDFAPQRARINAIAADDRRTLWSSQYFRSC